MTSSPTGAPRPDSLSLRARVLVFAAGALLSWMPVIAWWIS
jgi:hypothetical protein